MKLGPDAFDRAHNKEKAMFRKIALAAAAAAAIGAAALVPTDASAAWHRSGVQVRIGAPHYRYAPRCWTQRRLVRTAFGPRWRVVRVCR